MTKPSPLDRHNARMEAFIADFSESFAAGRRFDPKDMPRLDALIAADAPATPPLGRETGEK